MEQTDDHRDNSSMKKKADKCRETSHALKLVWTFLEHHLLLANSHGAEFISHNHWEMFVPEDSSRHQLLALTNQELVNLAQYRLGIGNRTFGGDREDSSFSTDTSSGQHKEEAGDWLSSFIAGANKCHLDNTATLSTMSDVVKACSDGSHVQKKNSQVISEAMSEKKNHEIEAMSAAVTAVFRCCNADVVVDVGSGKGYLGCELARHHNLPVLGLDSCHTNTHGAVTRDGKLAHRWNGLARRIERKNASSQVVRGGVQDFPKTRKKDCSKTSQQGSNCVQDCSKTSQQGSNCAQDCSKTSQQGSNCAKDCSKTSQQGSNCVQDCSKTSQQGSNCVQDCSKTSQQGSNCVQDCSKTSQQGSNCVQDCSKTSQQDSNCVPYCFKTSQQGSNCVQDCSKTSQQGSNCVQDCSKTSQQGSNCVQDCSKTSQQGSNCVQDCSKTSQQDSNCVQDCSKTSQQGSNCVQDCSKTSQQGSNCVQDCSKTSQQGSNCAQDCSKTSQQDIYCVPYCFKTSHQDSSHGSKDEHDCAHMQNCVPSLHGVHSENLTESQLGPSADLCQSCFSGDRYQASDSSEVDLGTDLDICLEGISQVPLIDSGCEVKLHVTAPIVSDDSCIVTGGPTQTAASLFEAGNGSRSELTLNNLQCYHKSSVSSEKCISVGLSESRIEAGRNSRRENQLQAGMSDLTLHTYVPVTLTVDPDMNLHKILQDYAGHLGLESRLWSDILLTGLHTCGSLSVTLMKLFLQNQRVAGLCFVGCCYQLMEESHVDTNEMPTPPLLTHFPLSTFGKQLNMYLGRNARNLASQSVARIQASGQLQGADFCWRAMLDVLLRELGIPVPARILGMRGLQKRSRSFQEYVQAALAKLKLSPDLISSKLVANVEERYDDIGQKMSAFFQLKLILAPAIESLILLDRFLYLLEQDSVHDAHLVRLFDPVTSPRCYGIVAVKKSLVTQS